MRDGRSIEAVLATGVMLAACAPLTTYRNSALTPEARPIDWDGVPVMRGAVRGDLSMSQTGVVPNLFPQPGSTAVLSATTMLDGSVGIAVARGLELGLRASFAAAQWNQPSAVGTMPIPGGGPVWGIGPELRGAFYVDRSQRLSLGVAFNAMAYQVPTAKWQLSPCAPSSTCISDPDNDAGQPATYQLIGESTTTLMAFNAGLYSSFSIGCAGRYGYLFAMLGMHSGFANDGFTDVLSSNSGTVWTSGFVGMAGGGYSFHLERLHLGAMLFVPFTGNSSPVEQMPGLMLTVGLASISTPPEVRPSAH